MDQVESSFDSAMLQRNEESHLINSRSSRRRLREQQLEDSCDIEEFKQQIELKFQLSTSNKYYSFPLTNDFLEYSSDGSLEELEEVENYVLISQNTATPPKLKDKFKIKEKERKKDTRKSDQLSKALLDSIRSHKNQLLACIKTEDRPVKKKSSDKNRYGTIIQMLDNQAALNQRLMTEPDELYMQKLKNRKK